MSGLQDLVWRRRFDIAENNLMARGYRVVNPAKSIIAQHPWLYRLVGYRLTLVYYLWLLRRCTHIAMVGNDWQRSRGARLERMKARQWNIKELK